MQKSKVLPLEILKLLEKNRDGMSGAQIRNDVNGDSDTFSQSTVSHALKKLSVLGFVEGVQDGRCVINKLTPAYLDDPERAKAKLSTPQTWQAAPGVKRTASKTFLNSGKVIRGAKNHVHRDPAELFSDIAPEKHTLLLVGGRKFKPEQLEEIARGGFQIEQATSVPRQHTASVVIIDGRNNTGEEGRFRNVEMLRKAKAAGSKPVFLIAASTYERMLQGPYFDSVFEEGQLSSISNHALTHIANPPGLKTKSYIQR